MLITHQGTGRKVEIWHLHKFRHWEVEEGILIISIVF